MKLRRTETPEAAETEVAVDLAKPGGKGRPTPKRRDAVGTRGPVAAPKTRKEAVARQRELAKTAKTQRRAPSGAPMNPAERREALRRGDPSVLPRRDQGATKAIARDYVDSRRLISNYMLLLFPIMIAGYVVPVLNFVTPLLFALILLEWYTVGRKIRSIATAQLGRAEGSAMGLGFYGGSRAYLPRKWRLPAPRVELGEKV